MTEEKVLISKKRMLFERLTNVKAKTVDWWMYGLKHKEEKKILSQNVSLKNKHAGKRCFVLGNGPSLKQVDFSLLTNEYVFTVNQIARNPNFQQLKTNFHFWADPAFFNIDATKAEDIELLNIMKSVRTEDNNPLVFMPIDKKIFVEKFQLTDDLDIRYFKSDLIFNSNFGEINYAKISPGFGTVVQWCISMAIYMGFSKIYLLGCDNTSIVTNIDAFLKNQVQDYMYQVTENEQKRMQALFENKTLYEYAQSYTRVLLDYIHLYYYTKKKGVQLINCTEKSAIDKIPFKSLQDVLLKKEN